MKNIKDYIKESVEAMVIVITIPKSTSWDDYMREIASVEDWKQQMNYKVPTLPVGVKDGSIKRCYVVHDGMVRGWMAVTGCQNISKGFVCSTTGTPWAPGNYIFRSGPFHPVNKDIPMKGFMGFRIVPQSTFE